MNEMICEKDIRGYLSNNNLNVDALLQYIDNHEIIEEDIFYDFQNGRNGLASSMLRTSMILFNTMNKWPSGYYPVEKAVFIRRIPIYFSEMDCGERLRRWITSLLPYKDIKERVDSETQKEVEHIYQILEFLFYEAHITFPEVDQYLSIQLGKDVIQLGEIKKYKFLEMWADYIQLCKAVHYDDPFPDRFLAKYNDVREKNGHAPIIYGYRDKEHEFRSSRIDDKLFFDGQFPCDGLGRPILKWIGIRTEDVAEVTCDCDHSGYGTLTISLTPKSRILVLRYVDKEHEMVKAADPEARECWEQEYAGPLKMIFNHTELKESRKAARMTQKELAEAIGVSVRTYQKWETGETKPDAQSVLRIINWLDINPEWLCEYLEVVEKRGDEIE